jgi:linoleoyl-CoA desaturase
VKAICEKYGLPYNSGRLSKQLGSVYAKIGRLALPFGRSKADAEPAIRIIPSSIPAAA